MRVAALEEDQHVEVAGRRAEAVDARDARDDDDVVALEQRLGGGVAHLVDLVVDRRVLLDVRVGRRDVGLGLVVVVVADEVADGVVGEERPELVVELRRERLVGRDDQRRPVHRGDHVRHGERLAAAGDAEQHLMRRTGVHALASSAAIACGWSPCGTKSARSRKRSLTRRMRGDHSSAAQLAQALHWLARRVVPRSPQSVIPIARRQACGRCVAIARRRSSLAAALGAPAPSRRQAAERQHELHGRQRRVRGHARSGYPARSS